MSLPSHLANLVLAQIQPPQGGEGNIGESLDLIAGKVQELQLFESFLGEGGEGGDLIFGGVYPEQVWKLGEEGEICDGVCV